MAARHELKEAYMTVGTTPHYPSKYDIFGVYVSKTDYKEALEFVMSAATTGKPMIATHLAVHGLMEAADDPNLRQIIDDFDIVAPDGQPVRHALNWIHKTDLEENCRGPEFVNRVCQRAAIERVGVYLYGSTEDVVLKMKANLEARFPGLRIVGAEPSQFRPLTREEDDALIQRIRQSRAGVVFIGLGCPLQERFAHDHRDKILGAQICVGAAFDFHAGNKKMAPVWMQKYSLEWLYRLLQEPRRLFKRYLITNTAFVLKLAPYLLHLRKPADQISPQTELKW